MVIRKKNNKRDPSVVHLTHAALKSKTVYAEAVPTPLHKEEDIFYTQIFKIKFYKHEKQRHKYPDTLRQPYVVKLARYDDIYTESDGVEKEKTKIIDIPDNSYVRLNLYGMQKIMLHKLTEIMKDWKQKNITIEVLKIDAVQESFSGYSFQ